MDDVQCAIAKLEIVELLSRFTLAIDSHDSTGWANCFAEDGMFVMGDRALRGRECLRAYADVHARLGSRHVTSSPIYDIGSDGATATGRATTVVFAATRSGYKTVFCGWYDDELRKVDGRWLIARRSAGVDGVPGEAPEAIFAADPEIAETVAPLLEAFQTLSVKV